MSNILIKGMQMPKNCTGCPLFESIFHLHGCHAVPKSFDDMDMWNFVGDRPSWCPLVKLPPHGRLIDADALLKSISRAIEMSESYAIADEYEADYEMVNDWLASAPTIIEAEEEET